MRVDIREKANLFVYIILCCECGTIAQQKIKTLQMDYSLVRTVPFAQTKGNKSVEKWFLFPFLSFSKVSYFQFNEIDWANGKRWGSSINLLLKKGRGSVTCTLNLLRIEWFSILNKMAAIIRKPFAKLFMLVFYASIFYNVEGVSYICDLWSEFNDETLNLHVLYVK